MFQNTKRNKKLLSFQQTLKDGVCWRCFGPTHVLWPTGQGEWQNYRSQNTGHGERKTNTEPKMFNRFENLCGRNQICCCRLVQLLFFAIPKYPVKNCILLHLYQIRRENNLGIKCEMDGTLVIVFPVSKQSIWTQSYWGQNGNQRFLWSALPVLTTSTQWLRVVPWVPEPLDLQTQDFLFVEDMEVLLTRAPEPKMYSPRFGFKIM